MSDWTVHLEFAEGSSSKFWRARVDGKTLYVNYGKIGAAGQTQVKDFADPAAARAEYDKLVREKRKKGYQDAGAAGATGEDDDDADEAEDTGGDEDGDDEDDERPARKARKPAAKPAVAARPTAAAAASAAAPSATASAAPGHRMVLDAGGRKVETTLYLDGKTMRMDAREIYASPDAAKQAFDRLKKLLGSDGYKDA